MVLSIIGVLAILLIAWLVRGKWKRENMSDEQVALVIEHYLYGGADTWGRFVEVRFKNPKLEHLRQLCIAAESKLPDDRERILIGLSRKLRSGHFKDA